MGQLQLKALEGVTHFMRSRERRQFRFVQLDKNALKLTLLEINKKNDEGGYKLRDYGVIINFFYERANILNEKRRIQLDIEQILTELRDQTHVNFCSNPGCYVYVGADCGITPTKVLCEFKNNDV